MPRSGLWAARYSAASAMVIGESSIAIRPAYGVSASYTTPQFLGSGRTRSRSNISRLGP
jgi:hypothetical protein